MKILHNLFKVKVIKGNEIITVDWQSKASNANIQGNGLFYAPKQDKGEAIHQHISSTGWTVAALWRPNHQKHKWLHHSRCGRAIYCRALYCSSTWDQWRSVTSLRTHYRLVVASRTTDWVYFMAFYQEMFKSHDDHLVLISVACGLIKSVPHFYRSIFHAS